MKQVIVLSFRDKCPEGYTLIDTTSRSKTWSRGLSPFLVGPTETSLVGIKSRNMENAWQYSKVYKHQLQADGEPSPEWFEWAKGGFSTWRGVRYPAGKGAIPEYSWWRGIKYDYIEARKNIYMPLYSTGVRETNAYKMLKAMYDAGNQIALKDFDGYRYDLLDMTLEEVVDCPKKKMGHAFVLAQMLEGLI